MRLRQPKDQHHAWMYMPGMAQHMRLKSQEQGHLRPSSENVKHFEVLEIRSPTVYIHVCYN
jgi:hypothetical protein